MKRFVVGDIHGAHKALVQVLERSGFDYENDLLITIGDIVDGWGQSYEVVEELLKIKNRIDIIGNHDNWFTEFINTSMHPEQWGQGALATAESYAKGVGVKLIVDKYRINEFTFTREPQYRYRLNLIADDIPESHQKFFKGQHRYYKDDNDFIFVHGGFLRDHPINETLGYSMMWDRKLWSQALSAASTHTRLKFKDDVEKIFIGHTTTQAWGKIVPMKADIIWNIDTGAGGGGKLTIMDVDTDEYWQSDLVNELYPDDVHNLRQ
jgi:serine/threonine protein phosphatase 1